MDTGKPTWRDYPELGTTYGPVQMIPVDSAEYKASWTRNSITKDNNMNVQERLLTHIDQMINDLTEAKKMVDHRFTIAVIMQNIVTKATQVAYLAGQLKGSKD